MLHAVAQLGEDVSRQVRGALGDEIHTDALAAHQAHDELDLLQQRLGRFVEEEMRFIEEEHDLRFGQIAGFRQVLIELGKHPEKECGIKRRMLEQLDAMENVDPAAPVIGGLHPVLHFKGRLPEEQVAALILQSDQAADDGAHRLRSDIPVFQAQLLGILGNEAQHGLQILQIQQQEAVFVGNAEGDVEDPCLGLVQAQDAGQEQRTHIADGGADRMAAFSVNIPEAGGIGLIFPALDGETGDALLHILRILAGGHHAAQIALDVREEHGHAHVGEALRHDLQSDGLAGAGSAGDEAVPIGFIGLDAHLFAVYGSCDPEFSVLIHGHSSRTDFFSYLYRLFAHIASAGRRKPRQDRSCRGLPLIRVICKRAVRRLRQW